MPTATATPSRRLEPVEVMRASGAHERYELPFEALFEWCRRTIGADTLDTVTLHDGQLMLVDDDGFAKCLPVNDAATALYASRCRPDFAPVIVGDVVIVEE
ncbi:MAG: DUF3846 domain-containing protein [Vicinamibacterales bacterium]